MLQVLTKITGRPAPILSGFQESTATTMFLLTGVEIALEAPGDHD